MVGDTAGVFDMVHVGHQRFLEQARARCDRLSVGITTDELCEQRKHKTPIVSLEDRKTMLRGLRCVDEVIPQTQMDRIATWTEHHFDITFVGDDWRDSDSWRQYEATSQRSAWRSSTSHTRWVSPARSCANVSVASSSQRDSIFRPRAWRQPSKRTSMSISRSPLRGRLQGTERKDER
jgi:glycerol-3-phosphate cytidylyltransferase